MQQLIHADESRGRKNLSEHLAVRPPSLFPEGDVSEEDPGSDDIIDSSSKGFYRIPHHADAVTSLFVHVTGCDDLSIWA